MKRTTLYLLALAMAPLSGADAQTAAPAEPVPDPGTQLVQDLVAANRILSDQGIVDGFGHVSVRDAARPDRFLIAHSMAPALVTAQDILAVDIASCTPADAAGRTTYLERFIHCSIYRRDPTTAAIVHSHSPAVIPFGVSQVELKPVYHMSGFLGATTPVFEIRDAGGMETDMLIRDARLGDALATALGDHAAVLMRGHGITVVGSSLPQAVFRAVYMEVNARLEAEALRLGPVTFLNASEAENAAATNDGQVGRAWELWRRQAMHTPAVE